MIVKKNNSKMNDRSIINKKIIQTRKIQNITQVNLALKLGMSISTYRRREQNNAFTIDELKKIAGVLNIHLDSLLKPEEEPKSKDDQFEYKTLIIEKINQYLKIMDEDQLKEIAKVCEKKVS